MQPAQVNLRYNAGVIKKLARPKTIGYFQMNIFKVIVIYVQVTSTYFILFKQLLATSANLRFLSLEEVTFTRSGICSWRGLGPW